MIKLSRPQASFLKAKTSLNLLHCGQGFGKTHLEGLISSLLIQRAPKAMGFIAANTQGQLSDSTLFRIFEVWKEYWGWSEFTKGNEKGVYVIDKEPPGHFTPHGYTFKTNQNKIFFINGGVIQIASLENYKALDGREISWAILDETKDTREQAIKEVILARLRAGGVYTNKCDNDFFAFTGEGDLADKPINPVWIFTSPAKSSWLGDMFNMEDFRKEIQDQIFNPDDYFCKSYNNKTLLIASAYFNQKNLPEDYISNKVAYLSKDRIEMLIYGSPFGKTGVEYYMNFNRQKHVKRVYFKKNNPIHISFDFNVNPYMTLIVKQVVQEEDRVKIKILKEYCLESPNNTIEGVCRAFLDDYEHLLNAGLYYYGDATGKNSLPIEDAKSFYKVVEKCLINYLQVDSKRLLKKNINHRAVGKNTLGRRDFMNKILSGNMGVDIEVDPSCIKVIKDFEYVTEDANGAKDKKKEKINGIICEPYGHPSDAIDGMVCYLYY
jgi:hypothetical protein